MKIFLNYGAIIFCIETYLVQEPLASEKTRNAMIQTMKAVYSM